jgi:hypothetical protein
VIKIIINILLNLFFIFIDIKIAYITIKALRFSKEKNRIIKIKRLKINQIFDK